MLPFVKPLRGATVRCQVVVSGAGPAGLLAARSILDHRPEAEVDVFEKRGAEDDEAPVYRKA